ncbi:hypothetical protein FHT86_006106 [Rhizobium sp. BK313]|jgi:hypothetical protein|uniref:hypothetical protein n=1 Tax=Rhizobium sp. BK313 TaxID=2587081 RepID=UPI0010618AA6|nr:hypothetical protein [Rhizobium sp. BK313]MBB3457788.1 hypothetical protein [Rhizobium sp. BK313]
MIKKTVLPVFVVAAFASSALIPGGYAQAQQFDGAPLYRQVDWHDQEWRHHHHHHNGSAIAGGVAAGLVGGLIGGAIANGGGYYEPAPPPPRCWHESRPVQNEYDDGYHYERVRVCD